MKSIRTFILIAIGMLAFTGSANTTADLGQKQKVDLVTECTTPMIQSQVVNVFQSINLIQTVFITVEGLNFKKAKDVVNFYTVSKDVGWQESKLNNTIYTKVAAGVYEQTNYKINKEKNPCRNDC